MGMELRTPLETCGVEGIRVRHYVRAGGGGGWHVSSRACGIQGCTTSAGSLGYPALIRPDLTCPSLNRPALTRPALTRPALTHPALTRPTLPSSTMLFARKQQGLC